MKAALFGHGQSVEYATAGNRCPRAVAYFTNSGKVSVQRPLKPLGYQMK